MTEVTDKPLDQLAVLKVDASQPGTLTLTLSEDLCCQTCGRIGPRWQIQLGPATPDKPTTARNLREDDPGG